MGAAVHDWCILLHAADRDFGGSCGDRKSTELSGDYVKRNEATDCNYPIVEIMLGPPVHELSAEAPGDAIRRSGVLEYLAAVMLWRECEQCVERRLDVVKGNTWLFPGFTHIFSV
jgi:hypothetical protein